MAFNVFILTICFLTYYYFVSITSERCLIKLFSFVNYFCKHELLEILKFLPVYPSIDSKINTKIEYKFKHSGFFYNL